MYVLLREDDRDFSEDFKRYGKKNKWDNLSRNTVCQTVSFCLSVIAEIRTACRQNVTWTVGALLQTRKAGAKLWQNRLCT